MQKNDELFKSLEKQANQKTSSTNIFNRVAIKARLIAHIIRVNCKLFSLLLVNYFLVIMGIIYLIKLIF